MEEIKILVVEDNDFVRMQMVRYLTQSDFQVIEATDGHAALETIKTQDDITLAIVDVRMSPVDGFTFIDLIRSAGHKIPVILVTGDDDPNLLAQSSDLGVSTVLLKPVEKDRLIQAVQRVVQPHKGKRD